MQGKSQPFAFLAAQKTFICPANMAKFYKTWVSLAFESLAIQLPAISKLSIKSVTLRFVYFFAFFKIKFKKSNSGTLSEGQTMWI